MNAVTSTVSGMKPPNPSRRVEAAPPRRGIPVGLSVHVVLIVLAALVWWIARDMVSVNSTLQNASRLKFELSEELRGEWRIDSAETLPVSLEVSGPSKRINEFASELSVNPFRYSYLYRISAEDIPAATAPGRPVTVRVNLEELSTSADVSTPAELSIRAVAGDRTYQVTLEPYVTRPAVVNLATGVTGEVTGYTYTAQVSETWRLRVRGPVSKVDRLSSTPGGPASLALSPPLNVREFVQNKALTARVSRDELLAVESRHTTMATLASIEDVAILRVRDDAEADERVSQVSIELLFRRQQDYEQVEGSFPVSVILPDWLYSKERVSVRGIERTQPVILRVLSGQVANFTEEHVRVIVDLSRLEQEEHFNITRPEESPGLTRAQPRVTLWYSLNIDRDMLTYEFPPREPEPITEDRYLPVTRLTIEWFE
jgi:hypothetical protein